MVRLRNQASAPSTSLVARTATVNPHFSGNSGIGTPIIRTPAEFHRSVLSSLKPVLVKFAMPRCDWCDKATPVLNRLQERHGGQFQIVEVNIGEGPQREAMRGIIQSYQLEDRGFPTFSLFRQRQEVGRLNVNRIIFENLESHLASLLGV